MEDWVFDSVGAFLHSPAWTTPVETFIEGNCVHFDTAEENKLIYTELHQKFRELIESLLSSHLKEMGVSIEEFAEVCAKALTDPQASFVIHHILLIDDFMGFKDMMIGKNIELQERASMLVKQKKSGKEIKDVDYYAVLTRSKEDAEDQAAKLKDLTKKEMEDLTNSIKASLAEMSLSQERISQEEAELNRAIALSLEEERQRLLKLSLQQQEETKQIQKVIAEEQHEPVKIQPKKSEPKVLPKKVDPSEERERKRRETLRARIEKAKMELGLQKDEKEEAKPPAPEKVTAPMESVPPPTEVKELAVKASNEKISGSKQDIQEQKDELIAMRKEYREHALEEWEKSKQTIKARLSYFEAETRKS